LRELAYLATVTHSTQLYNKAVWDVLVEEKGADHACLFARSAVAGGQTLPVHWGGDCDQEWTGMAETIRGGLSLSLSGFGYFSHDIAGFKAEGKNSSVHKGRKNEAAI
jgi:alpha-D-xyloside xylohydrolase